MRFRSIVEKALTNKFEADNAKKKYFEALADLEELIFSELNINKYKMRAEQRVLDKYRELDNDTDWRLLETIDDFIRDQLTDCQAFTEVSMEITKAQQKMVALKNTVDSKTEVFINMEKKQTNVNKVKN